jgi:undecaprenyl-diphosphatase
LIIGLFQAVAIFPGVSRSGSTIAGGLLRNLDRDFAVRFAFLLSIPAILGAFVLQMIELGSTEVYDGTGIIQIITGTTLAAITGFFSIKLMVKLIRERSLLGFSIYTGILGILVIIDQFATRIFF